MSDTGFSGMASLDAMIATARGLFEGPAFAQVAARSTETWLRSTLAVGQDPDTGSAWAPTKAGKRPLKSAASQPTVTLAGSNIIVRIKGYYVFQHFGTRGSVARHVIPIGDMPSKLGNAIRAGLVEPFVAKTKAGKRGGGR